MNVKDNYLEVSDTADDRLYRNIYRQILSSDKWSKAGTQEAIEESKVPAFCLKTKDTKTKRKIFVNFCHSPEMKAPTLDLNEEELRSLLTSEAADSFTIPLLLTQMKNTRDKSGSEGLVVDVIINTDFYLNKVVFSELYKTFLITVTLETIERDKYNGPIEKSDWILLKNKKYQEVSGDNRSNNNNINDKSCDKTIVNDLSAKLNIYDINNDKNGGNDGFDYQYSTTNRLIASTAKDEPKTGSIADLNDRSGVEGVVGDERPEHESTALTPKYKFALNVANNRLDGQIIVPSVCDTNQIDLRIGEDRILMSASNYKLDIFVPVLVKCDQVMAVFDAFTHTLDLKMPLN